MFRDTIRKHLGINKSKKNIFKNHRDTDVKINLNCINDILQYLDNYSKKMGKEYVYFFIHINDIISAMHTNYSKTEIKRSIDYLVKNEFLNIFKSPYDNEMYICNNDDCDLDFVQLIFKIKTNSHNKRAGE